MSRAWSARALVPWLLVACAHPPAPVGMAAATAPIGLHEAARGWTRRTLALKHSHYYGELYDDNERLMLSPYAFQTLYHRVDLAGTPITPGPAHGIVPAGTRVVVDAIEFPGPLAFLKRMLNAPTAHIWVRLHVSGEEEALVHGAAAAVRPLIIVLEAPVHDPGQLDAAMAELFGEVASTRAWLAGLRPRVRVAVEQKHVLRGMQQAELVASQGEPWRWLTDQTAEGRQAKVAWYPGHEAWLVGEVVVEVRRARQATPTPP